MVNKKLKFMPMPIGKLTLASILIGVVVLALINGLIVTKKDKYGNKII